MTFLQVIYYLKIYFVQLIQIFQGIILKNTRIIDILAKGVFLKVLCGEHNFSKLNHEIKNLKRFY